MGAVWFSIDESLLQLFTGNLPVEIFVETGTFEGKSLMAAKSYFKECHSVELSPHYYRAAVETFQGEPGIHLHEGASPDVLAKKREKFASRPTVFWLDAHWCVADNTAGEESQSPLLGELEAIGQLQRDSVVLIDDARLYLCAPPKPHRLADWPDFHSVVEKLFSLSTNHRLTVCNDVMIFAPHSIQDAVSDYAHHHGVDWLHVMQESQRPRKKKKKRGLAFWKRH